MSDIIYPAFVVSFKGQNVECTPLARQPYLDCFIEAGVTDHTVDTIYLRFSRDGEEPTTIFLRPDEAAAVCWTLSGAVYSAFLEVIMAKETDHATHEPDKP